MANISKYNTLNSNVQQNIYNRQNGYQGDPIQKRSSPGEGIPRIVVVAADSAGCFWWRLGHPSSYLSSYGKAIVSTIHAPIQHPSFFNGVDCVILQRQCSSEQIQYIAHLRALSENMKKQFGKGFKIIWEVDDVVAPANAIPFYNQCRGDFQDPDIEKNLRTMFTLIDEMTVPSQAMRYHYGTHFNFRRISVIPNYMPKYLHDRYCNIDDRMKLYHKNYRKPKVLYSGSGTHFDVLNATGQKDDFDHVMKEIEETRNDFSYIFQGGYPLRFSKYIQNGEMTHLPWVPLFEVPAAMHSIGAQVAIAPLANNIFNHSKAAIKITESGILGIPCVAQNLQCYKDGLYKFNTGAQMIQQIKNITINAKMYKKSCEQSREYAESTFLDDHLDEYMLIYSTHFDDPNRWKNKSYLENNTKMEPLPELDEKYFKLVK